MPHKCELSPFKAVIFSNESLGLYVIFGPSAVFELFANASDVSVVTRHELTKIPTKFCGEAIAELGRVSSENVLFLPWSLLPSEFNVVLVDESKHS